MPPFSIEILLLLLGCLNSILAEWTLNLEYSTTGLSFEPLGTITLKQNIDGNYTGAFRPKTGVSKGLKQALLDLTKKPDLFYYVKSDDLMSFNNPCLLLRSNLAHSFALTIDAERQHIYSLTVFPAGIFDTGKEEFECDGLEISPNAQLTGDVMVSKVGELPSPDTASYLQRMEDEKRSRQHGASQDNRSFIAKYWMYIVPVVLFMVLSNAFNADPGQEGGGQ